MNPDLTSDTLVLTCRLAWTEKRVMQTMVAEMSPTPLKKEDRRCKPIDPAVVQCLGTMKDQDVADKFGRKLKWVRKARQRLGISAYTGGLISPKLMKDAEVMNLLGKWSDRLLAEHFGGVEEAL